MASEFDVIYPIDAKEDTEKAAKLMQQMNEDGKKNSIIFMQGILAGQLIRGEGEKKCE